MQSKSKSWLRYAGQSSSFDTLDPQKKEIIFLVGVPIFAHFSWSMNGARLGTLSELELC